MKSKKAFIVIMVYSLVVFMIAAYNIAGTRAVATTAVVDIGLNPTVKFIDVSNMKPGDTIEQELTVKNDGNVDFNYNTTAKYESGHVELYNQLKLEVRDQTNKTLYSGALSGLSGFAARFLPSRGQETLTFLVEFPWESGNEFQGKATNVALEFSANWQPPENPPPENPPPENPPPENPPPENPPPENPPPENPPPENPPPENPPPENPPPENPPPENPPPENPPPENPPPENPPPENPPPENPPPENPPPENPPPENPPPENPPPDDPPENGSGDLEQFGSGTGIELPKTSSPWYNLLFISGIFVLLSIILLWIVLKIDRSKDWDV